MKTEDSEFTLVFIAPNSIGYLGPVYDGVFSATTRANVTDYGLGSVYFSDTLTKGTWFSTIACHDQTRICGKDSCTPLTSSPKLDFRNLGLNSVQEATALRIKTMREHSNVWNMVHMQGSAALMASDLIMTVASPALPSDQWVLEVTTWYQSLLANLQYQAVEFPNNAEGTYPIVQADGILEKQCYSQLVRNTAEYQSFSLSGVLIIVVVSAALIVLSWTLESCVFAGTGRQSGAYERYKRLAYSADGKHQLLRSTLEAAGYGAWKDELEHIPYRDLPPQLQKDIHPITADTEEVVIQMQEYPSKPQSFSSSSQFHAVPPQEERDPSRRVASPYRPVNDYHTYSSYGSEPIPMYENLGPVPARIETPKQTAVNSPPMGYREDEHVPFIRRW